MTKSAAKRHFRVARTQAEKMLALYYGLELTEDSKQRSSDIDRFIRDKVQAIDQNKCHCCGRIRADGGRAIHQGDYALLNGQELTESMFNQPRRPGWCGC